MPEVFAYRLRLLVAETNRLRINISADERYEFFIDGLSFGQGSERGSPQRWHCESYDLVLETDEHLRRAFSMSSSDPSPVRCTTMPHPCGQIISRGACCADGGWQLDIKLPMGVTS